MPFWLFNFCNNQLWFLMHARHGISLLIFSLANRRGRKHQQFIWSNPKNSVCFPQKGRNRKGFSPKDLFVNRITLYSLLIIVTVHIFSELS